MNFKILKISVVKLNDKRTDNHLGGEDAGNGYIAWRLHGCRRLSNARKVAERKYIYRKKLVKKPHLIQYSYSKTGKEIQ